jgi:two-component system chemotaxis response regulator CheY
MKEITALVVDDMSIICDSMVKTLTSLGVASVHIAKDAVTALEVFNKFRIDLVFMDINLDGESGLDVMGQLKEIDNDVYTIVLSGESNIANVRKSISLGAKGFVVKPYTNGKIQEVLDVFNKKL